VYVGFVAVLVNVIVAVLITMLCKALKAPDGVDLTTRDDYFADEGDPRIGPPTVDTPAEPALL
jgi:SSS family solute:Na+ symporter